MKVIYNNVIPFKGFLAINLFGVLFVRKDASSGSKLSDTTIRHESIHTAQMKELGYIFFYLIYFIEWIIRLFTNPGAAYYSISFEQEAYNNQYDRNYLKNRKHFAQWRKKQ